jgi:protein-disulfide isomerase
MLSGIPQSGERLGRSTAPVVVTLYGDLECPICRKLVLSRAFARLITSDVRTGKASIVYRSFCTSTCDLSGGRRVFVSQQAAAYAAGVQRRFWQYALLFLQRQGVEDTHYVTTTFLDRLAHDVPGLAFARWQTARENPALARKVRNDDRAAGRHHIEATPTLIFTGPAGVKRVQSPVPTFKQLSAALAAVS